MAMLKTTLPGFDNTSFRQAWKALYPGDKEEKKKVLNFDSLFPPVSLCFTYLSSYVTFSFLVNTTTTTTKPFPF